MKYFLWSSLLGCALISGVFAQDFERYAPKVLQRGEGVTEVVTGLPEVDDSEEVLVEKLRGLVLVPESKAVVKTGLFAEGLQIKNVPAIEQDEEFQKVLSGFIGKPVTMRLLSEITREIVLFYRNKNLPVTDAVITDQDITNGVVQVIVMESLLGELSVFGNRWFTSERIAGYVRIKPGSRINSEVLLKDIEWINLNPFRRADLVLNPGKEVATTDVRLKVWDRFPARFYAGYEDTGNDLTYDERWLAGFNWGDAFFLDHQLNYQFTTSSDFRTVNAHTLSYIMPLPWRHTLMMFSGFTSTEADLPAFRLEGASAQVGVRYTVPLPEYHGFTHEAFAGFDWKQSDNSLEFGTVPVNATTTDIGQMVFGYRARLPDALGSTSGEINWFISPGGLFDHQRPEKYAAVRPGAEDSYQYMTFKLERMTRLPWKFSVFNEFTYQISDKNLLPSEQMTFGGHISVRGYDERELNNTDEGWILRNEFRLPPFAPLALMGLPVQDELQFLVFWDYGVAWASQGKVSRIDALAFDHVNMSGIGPGLRYRLNSWLSVRADYGFQLTDTGNARNSSRWHLGVIVSY